MKKLFIAVFLICKVSFASIDDSAIQLAAELFSRQQVADKIREMYVAAFPIAERREVIAKAVDAYLATDFPWQELERLAIEDIRARLTADEQKQVLGFVRSDAGKKFTAMQFGATGPLALLLERESEKLFGIVSREARDQKRSPTNLRSQPD